MNLFKRIFTKFQADLDMEVEKESNTKALKISNYISKTKQFQNQLSISRKGNVYIYHDFEVIDDVIYVNVTNQNGRDVLKFNYYSFSLKVLFERLRKNRERFITIDTSLKSLNYKIINENNI